MADYFPKPDNFASLAAQTLRMKAEQASPWAALAQSVGNTVDTYGQGKLDQKKQQAKFAQEKELVNIKDFDAFKKTHRMATEADVSGNPKIKQVNGQVGEWYPNRLYEPDAPKSAGGGGSATYHPTADEQKLLNDAQKEGRMNSNTTKRYNLEQQVRMLQANPKFDFVSNDAQGAGKKSEAASSGKVRGDAGAKTEATGQTLDEILNEAEPLANKVSPTGVRGLDAGWQKALAATNHPDAVKLKTLMASAQSLYAQNLRAQGTPTDKAASMAEKAVADGLSGKGFKAMRSAVKMESGSRAKNLQAAGSSGTIQPAAVKPVGNPADRFGQLIKQGHSEDEAYKILAAEGH